MEFYLKLPRCKKEFALFMAIVSIISVNIIAPLITCFEINFSFETWGNSYRAIPFIWFSVIIIVLITYKPAEFLTDKIIEKDDSFKARILANIICTVFLMSIILTVVGSWIGEGKISMTPIYYFFHKWPRNFSISFAIEFLIAQPIARFVMQKIHTVDNSE